MSEENSTAETTQPRRGLTSYNIVMLLLTLVVITAGVVLVLSERSAKNKAQAFYDDVQSVLGEGEFIKRTSIQRMAEESAAKDPVSFEGGTQIDDTYRWSGLLQNYEVTISYVRATSVATRAVIETQSRFGGAEE